MPRFCKVCEEEFASAAKLAHHMKCSDCSNHISCLSCRYCGRDDFINVDSLNRHLSHNRQCSRADYEATDKLYILAPEPALAKSSAIKGSQLSSQPWNNQQHYDFYVDALHDLQGNLVNVANNTGMLALQRQNTSLHPNASSLQVVVRLTKDYDPKGTVEKEIVRVETYPTTTTTCDVLKTLQKGPSVESNGTSEKCTNGELPLNGSQPVTSDIEFPQESDVHQELPSAVDFNADDDEGYYESEFKDRMS